MSPRTRLYLHIGTKKTGTTSIQSSMMNNIQQLRSAGYYVPKRFGDLMANGLFRLFRKNDDVESKNAEMNDFESEIGQVAEDGIYNTILSAEALVDLLPEEIADLRDYLANIYDEVRIILYMRRQDLCATSHYSTALRGGGTSKALISQKIGPGRRGIQYDLLIEDWSRAFGEEGLILRIYEPDMLEKGNAVVDFYKQIGVPDDVELADVKSKNTSLSGNAQAFLRLYNEIMGPKTEINEATKNHLLSRLVGVLETVSSGRGLNPSVETAKEYYEEFRESNETVRARFFPDRETLFVEDFSMYPEDAPDIDAYASPEVLMEEFVSIWAQVQRPKKRKGGRK